MNTVASTVAGTRTLRRGAIAVPRAPRRVSGPARRRGPSLVDRATGVADARLLDRLIRGRGWIAVIGVMLMGLVFVQVSMLRLNTGIGRDVATAAQLERDNQGLRNTVAELGAGDRIETEAQRLGMVMPAAGQVHYVRAGAASPQTAALAVSTPAPVVQQPGAGGVVPGTTPTTGTAAAQPGAAVAQTAAPVTQQTAAPAAQQTAAPAAATTQQTAPATQPQATQSPPAAQTAVAPATGGAAPTP